MESQSFSSPPIYSPDKQPAKTKTCSATSNMAELGDFEKVIIPKQPRSAKKNSSAGTGEHAEGNDSGEDVPNSICPVRRQLPDEVQRRHLCRENAFI